MSQKPYLHEVFRQLLNAQNTPTARTASKTPRPFDEGEIKKAFGYAPDDPSVVIVFKEIDGFDPQAPLELDEAGFRAATAPVTEVADAAFHHDEPGTERWTRAVPGVLPIFDEVFKALEHAITKHRPMNSPHEGYAVIKEELDELWDEIKCDGGGRDYNARAEALQVAAMAIRYVLDLDPRAG